MRFEVSAAGLWKSPHRRGDVPYRTGWGPTSFLPTGVGMQNTGFPVDGVRISPQAWGCTGRKPPMPDYRPISPQACTEGLPTICHGQSPHRRGDVPFLSRASDSVGVESPHRRGDVPVGRRKLDGTAVRISPQAWGCTVRLSAHRTIAPDVQSPHRRGDVPNDSLRLVSRSNSNLPTGVGMYRSRPSVCIDLEDR